jgi:hypothetical protein
MLPEWAMTPRTSALVAAPLFAAEAAFAIVHRALGGEYLGFTHGHNVVIDLGLAVVWGGAAVACALHRSWPAFMWMLVGSAVSLIHGVMFCVASGPHGPYGLGIPFLVASGVQLFLWAHAGAAFLERPTPREHRTGGLAFWHRHPESAH